MLIAVFCLGAAFGIALFELCELLIALFIMRELLPRMAFEIVFNVLVIGLIATLMAEIS